LQRIFCKCSTDVLKDIKSFARFISPVNIQRFINSLAQLPEVIECNQITVGDNMIIKVALRRTEELEKRINKLIEFGVPNTSIVLSTPIENRILSLN